MPAKSKKQQKAAGAALAAKRGKVSKSALKGASRGMAKSMSEKQLKEFAGTKRKKLPTKASSAKSKTGGRKTKASSRKSTTGKSKSRKSSKK